VAGLSQRQEAITWFAENSLPRHKIIAMLKDVADLERLINRVRGEIALPRELVTLRRSLEAVPELKKILTQDGHPEPVEGSVPQEREADSHDRPSSEGLPQNDSLRMSSSPAVKPSTLLPAPSSMTRHHP
jgi:DNA mismatch repair ATPase MutS